MKGCLNRVLLHLVPFLSRNGGARGGGVCVCRRSGRVDCGSLIEIITKAKRQHDRDWVSILLPLKVLVSYTHNVQGGIIDSLLGVRI